MGLFDAIIGVAASVISSVCSAAVSIARTIGGPAMGGIANFIGHLSILFPDPMIGLFKLLLFSVIPAVTEILGLKQDREETPEELGRKAEIAYEENQATPEDFASTEEYIRYLREEIHLDRKELEVLSDEQRMKYAAFGNTLYVRSMEEKYGTKLEPEFWRAAAFSGMEPDRVAAVIPALREHGIESGKLVDDYFSRTLQPGSPERENVADALAQAVGQRLGTSEILPIRTEMNQYVRTYNQTREQS